MTQSSLEHSNQVIPKEYPLFLLEIKEKILSSQVKAALAVNRELINLYWEIGSRIHLKQKSEGWGAKTIENLSKDLKTSFPDMEGFSSRNLKYMVHFAREYPDFAIGQQFVAQIPWGHNILLPQKLTSPEERLWCVNKTIENGWSRNILLHWLDSNLYKREKGKVSVSQYETALLESLPAELKGALPTIEKIERELEDQRVLTERDNL